MNESITDTAVSAKAATINPRKRNRIVILGRTQAGKTVYLAALYDACWNKDRRVQVEAIDGRSHTAMMESIETLRSGKWPSSTSGIRYMDLMAKCEGVARPLTCIDYPGEVFSKAFIDGVETDDVQELLEHIDQAAAVIVLVDPKVVAGAPATKSMDDNFGMAKAIERIRSWPGGDDVPIAIVLTKCDKYRKDIRSLGGPVAFARDYYPSLIKAAGRAKVFECSAVSTRHKGNGSSHQSRKYVSEGVVEPLRWAMNELNTSERRLSEEQRAREARKYHEEKQKENMKQEQKAKKLWIVGWILFIVLFTAVAVVVSVLVLPS